MKYFIMALSFSFCTNAMANCLDISGTYKMSYTDGFADCANGSNVVSTWIKYVQNSCSTLTYSKVYKLRDDTFCEGRQRVLISDGQRHTPNDGSQDYEYQMLFDRHTLIWFSSNGSIGSSDRYLDTHGNLVIDTGSGHPATYERKAIQ